MCLMGLFLLPEPGPKPTWESRTERMPSASSEMDSGRNRPPPYRQFSTTFDISQYMTYSPSSINMNGNNYGQKEEKKESYKEISRRLDCKYFCVLSLKKQNKNKT